MLESLKQKGRSFAWFWALILATSPQNVAAQWWNPFEQIGRLNCLISYCLLPFDLADVSQFDTFFREDSVFELAEVGRYVGVDDITEYVEFIYNTTSIYWSWGAERLDTVANVIGYQDGLCVLETALHSRYIMNDAVASSAQEFEVVSLVKVFLQPSGLFGLPGFFGESYYTRANFFLYPGYIEYIFNEQLSGQKTIDYLCNSVMYGSCAGVVTTPADCSEKMQALPTTNNGRADGDSLACRVVHGNFASDNPADHCAHILFEPTADPRGRIKCQEVGTTTSSDLFTEEDLAMLDELARGWGIDPALGYKLIN